MRRRLLIAAGISWGFAFGCRASAALPAALFVAITALAVAPPVPGHPRAWRLPARSALWMASPIAAAVAAQLAYNKLRFGVWFDFGLSKQLSTMNFRTAPAYLVPNLYNYLLRPLQPSCRFPFLTAQAELEASIFPDLLLPRGYRAPEPVAGMLTQPPGCCWPGWRPSCWRARSAPRAAPRIAHS